MLECKSKDLSLLKTRQIYKDFISKEIVDKELVKKLNNNKLPTFEYNS